MVESLRGVARGETASHAPVDQALSVALLHAVAGEFDAAESKVAGLLAETIAAGEPDPETVISFLHALFVVQRFDILAALLRDRFAFPRRLEIAVADGRPGVGKVEWTIMPGGTHRFTFDAGEFAHDNTRHAVLIFNWEFPLFANYACRAEQEVGSVIVNHGDIGYAPGLAYCDNRPNRFLLPDYSFVPTKAYAFARQWFAENPVAWSDRIPKALWRGASTGMQTVPGQWRNLPRFRLCRLAHLNANGLLIDAGISSIVQFHDAAVIEEIKASGLMRPPIPWQQWNTYRYQIDIDGNSSPWSNLIQRLLTGSPVLKVESQYGFQQWYYDQLRPWHNYIPVSPDMAELVDKIEWLKGNDSIAQKIGAEGWALAQRLTYEREIERSGAVISSAFRYFNGHPDGEPPFGRAEIEDFKPG